MSDEFASLLLIALSTSVVGFCVVALICELYLFSIRSWPRLYSPGILRLVTLTLAWLPYPLALTAALAAVGIYLKILPLTCCYTTE